MKKLLYEVQDYRKKRVIIDTDAACEADDPFAIAHALLSKMLEVKGICAEHFVEEGSMEKSYQMIQKVLMAMDMEVPIWRGQEGKLSDNPEEPLSEAAEFIIEEAMRESEKPLYVLCIGAITNVAKAILAKPAITGRMTVVWIGGNALECENPAVEFNSGNDVEAANVVFASGTDLWLIPNTVYGTMHIGFAEIQQKIYPYGKIGKFLYEHLLSFYSSENAAWSAGESWSLGDSPAIGVTLEPNCGTSVRRRAPRLREDGSYEFPEDNPYIKVYTSINSRFILEDFICKLQIVYPK